MECLGHPLITFLKPQYIYFLFFLFFKIFFLFFPFFIYIFVYLFIHFFINFFISFFIYIFNFFLIKKKEVFFLHIYFLSINQLINVTECGVGVGVTQPFYLQLGWGLIAQKERNTWGGGGGGGVR